jgi:MFS family permease
LSPGFRRLWVASALSNLADGVFQVALPLLAVTLTKSPALVAGVALAQRLPWLVMALPAGALADRLDRRRTMVRVDVLRVVVMGALAIAVGLDAASMPVLYVAAVVLGVGETLFDTAAQSILPSLVDRSQLSTANGRLQAVELTTNQFIGPPLGGVLAAAALASAFAVSAGAYLLAALVLVAIAGSFRPERPVDGTGATRSMRTDIAEGVRFVWHNAVLRTLALMLGATNLGWTAYYAVFVLYAVRPGPMGLSKAGYGLFVTVGAVGGLVGAWLGPRVERVLGRARSLLLAVTVFGAALAVPAITASVALNAVAFGMAGLWSVVWNVITVSLRQRITPDRLLGRMNSTYRLLGWGTMPLGAALGGAIAQWVGLRAAFAVAALVHVPLLLGFFVVTERRILDAEAAYTSNLSA